MLRIRRLNFEEWKAENPDLVAKQLIEETCVECDGSGLAECDCCGSFYSCPECGATGKVKEVDERALHSIYEQEIEREDALLKKNHIEVTYA